MVISGIQNLVSQYIQYFTLKEGLTNDSIVYMTRVRCSVQIYRQMLSLHQKVVHWTVKLYILEDAR